MPGAPIPPPAGCPCGSGQPYDACCGPFHRGSALPPTPEALMRSRYSAYAVGDTGYVFRTWHPRTRPEDVSPDPATVWTGLEILDAVDDEVEFVASYDTPSGPGRMHERSRFAQRAGRWLYLDGDVT
ncbi:MAG: YchJ family protein [Nocardioides sp.]|uniref:YchJ family protein n=1 Tax=Nocardioides sp. TaxID=35761 RepID=UPI003EFFE08F